MAFCLVPRETSSAQALARPLLADASGVIDAVNSLRNANGLSPYTVSSTLMGIAQAHAEYMAANGSVTHTGAGGTRPYERALAAGYPLAGQLPPGFFSENIQAGTGLSPSEAVQAWTGDAPHMNTMTSPMLLEIGAGVAESGGMIYYVIDCARPTTGGLPQAYTPGAESAFNSSNEIIVPVSKSTPNSSGELMHEVQSGQSLWQIAISYGVKIEEIRRLNALATTYVIQPGDMLLVKQVGTATPEPTATADISTMPSLSGMIPSPQPAQLPSILPTETTIPTATAPESNPAGASGAVGAIIVVALVAAGLVAWAGRARPV